MIGQSIIQGEHTVKIPNLIQGAIKNLKLREDIKVHAVCLFFIKEEKLKYDSSNNPVCFGCWREKGKRARSKVILRRHARKVMNVFVLLD